MPMFCGKWAKKGKEMLESHRKEVVNWEALGTWLLGQSAGWEHRVGLKEELKAPHIDGLRAGINKLWPMGIRQRFRHWLLYSVGTLGHRWTFEIDSWLGTLILNPSEVKCYLLQRIPFVSLANLYLNSILNYYILNSKRKNVWKYICSLVMLSTYVIYSICWLAHKTSNIHSLDLYRKRVLSSSPGYQSWILEADISMFI